MSAHSGSAHPIYHNSTPPLSAICSDRSRHSSCAGHAIDRNADPGHDDDSSRHWQRRGLSALLAPSCKRSRTILCNRVLKSPRPGDESRVRQSVAYCRICAVGKCPFGLKARLVIAEPGPEEARDAVVPLRSRGRRGSMGRLPQNQRGARYRRRPMLGASVEYRRGVQNGVPAKRLRLPAECQNGNTGNDQSFRFRHRTVSSSAVPKGCPPRGSQGRGDD
jgi:hypothetical protein